MPQIKTIMSYSFDELDKHIQEKIVNNLTPSLIPDDWYADIYDIWKDKLGETGFLEPEIKFSGFWSQGDGARFTCEYIDLEKFIQAYPELSIQAVFPHVKLFGFLKDNCRLYIGANNSSYFHEDTARVDYEL